MELVILVTLIVFGLFTYFYPRIVFLLLSLFWFLALTIDPNGTNSIEGEFFVPSLIALITVAIPCYFTHLFITYPRSQRWMIMILATLSTFVLTWIILTFSYNSIVTAVMRQSCPTCTKFNYEIDPLTQRFKSTYEPNLPVSEKNFKYAFNPDALLSHCVVWDDTDATTKCFYSSEIWQIAQISLSLALVSLGITYWYTQQVIEFEFEVNEEDSFWKIE